MNKKLFKVLAVMMCLALVFALAACGGNSSSGSNETKKEESTKEETKKEETTTNASAGEVVKLDIVHIASENDPIHDGWTFLKNALEEKSGGRFQVTIYGNKSIANSDIEAIEKVQQNICQMTSGPSSSYAAIGNIQEYQVFDYPYLCSSYDDFYTILDSDLAKGWATQLEEKAGIRTLGGYALGWQQIASTKPLNTLESYKGQKIRTMSSDVQIAIINSFGANATIVNYGEVFTALQQGTVDGLMTSTGLMVSDKFYEVTDYLSVAHPTAILHIPCVNAEWYNNLPEDLKAIYDETIPEYMDAIRSYEEAFDQKALQTLADNGLEVTEYSDEELKPFIEASQKVYTEQAGVAGAETIAAVQALLGK